MLSMRFYACQCETVRLKGGIGNGDKLMATAYLSPAEMARADAQNLAAEILAGKFEYGPYGRGGVYGPHDWRDAAQYLTDSDDCDEVLFMIAQEEEAERRNTGFDRATDDTFWRDSSYAIDRGMGE